VDEAFRFSESDPGWADALFEWLKDRNFLRANYYANMHTVLGQDFVYPIADKFEMAVVGDAGTGNRQSVMLFEKMVQQLNADLFVHLGDVYYAGSSKQFSDFYLKPLMNAFGVQSPADLKGRVWTLPGNHDYYSGGGPYFEAVAQVGSHKGSYFCLQNAHFVFIGLDTCLEDANPVVTAEGVHCTFVPPEQLHWAKTLIAQAKAQKKAVVLFSHHMLFSQHETTGRGKTLSYANEAMMEQFQDCIHQIDIWQWGHEHSWTRWAPYRGLKRGYLLGNGGVPVLQKENMYAVKPVPGHQPPKMLSKPPAVFTIRDSLSNYQDLSLWCNGLYGFSVDGPNLTLKYWELHETQPDAWALEAVETQIFTVGNSGDLVEV
jgi:hypothetical protein